MKRAIPVLCLFISFSAMSQLPPPTEDAADAFPAQKHFSPYAGRNFPTRVYWGETHLHTLNKEQRIRT